MRKIILLLIFLFASYECAIGQTRGLTLNDCVQRALGAPSSVTVAREDTKIAAYGTTAARAALLPQAQWNNAFIYNTAPLVGSQPLVSNIAGAMGVPQNLGSFIALNGIREYQSLLTATLEIDTSGRLRAALSRARSNQQIAQADLAITERDLKRSVTAAYYEVLLARLLTKANKQVLDEAEAFANRTRGLSEAGEVARADLVKADSQVAFFQQAVNSAELDEKIANANLASFWTDAVDDELQLVDTLENPPQPPEEPSPGDKPFLRRFEFSLLSAQEKGFQADYRREIAQLLPQLSFTYEYGIDASRLAWRDRGQAVIASVNFPIFDWFRSRSLARSARTQAEQVATNRAITERSFSRDYRIALARARQLYAQITITEEQVKTSDENLRLSRIRYEGGEGAALDVVAAQEQVAQALTNHYVGLAAYANALADLEIASGR